MGTSIESRKLEVSEVNPVQELQNRAQKVHEKIIAEGCIHCCNFSRAVATMNDFLLQLSKGRRNIKYEDVVVQIEFVEQLFGEHIQSKGEVEELVGTYL